MSDNPVWHSCKACGHLWLHGTHGGHNCAGRLREQLNLAALERDNARVIIDTQTRELKDAAKTLEESQGATALALETLSRVIRERDMARTLVRRLWNAHNRAVAHPITGHWYEKAKATLAEAKEELG